MSEVPDRPRVVSVVVPCYNQAEYLEDAINSLIEQTYPHWECIIVNDGSSDATEMIGSRLSARDKRVRLITQKNCGLAGARNTGLREIVGDYVQFLDADDLLFPTKLEKQIALMQQAPGPAVSYCRPFFFLGKNLEKEIAIDRPFSELDLHDPVLDLARRWERGLSIPCHAFLFDTSLFDGIVFDEELPNHEDWDCWMGIFSRRPRVYFADEKLIKYRRHETSMCRDETAMRSGFLRALRKQHAANAHDLSLRWVLGSRINALERTESLGDALPLDVNPQVSVILTSYNYERYVSESIRSVFSQTYRNIQLIVVDDGSSDNSVAVIEEVMRDCPFPCEVICKTNGGQSSAFNAGFQHATGNVVAFLDSDDYWHADRLEKVIDFMRLFPGGAVYQHQLDTGLGLKRNSLMSADIFPLWIEWGGGVLNLADDHDGLLIAPFVPTSGLTFPKVVLDKVFPIPDALITCPDAFLTRTSVVHGPLISIPATLGVWRDHGENAGRTGKATFDEYWRPVIMPALNAYYAAHNIPLRLLHDPAHRSKTPAARILGEGFGVAVPRRNQSPDSFGGSPLPREFSRAGHSIARLLRLMLPAEQVEDIRRFVRREPPRIARNRKNIIKNTVGHRIANRLRAVLSERQIQQIRRFVRRN